MLFHEISVKSKAKIAGNPVLREEFWLECDLPELADVFQRALHFRILLEKWRQY